MGLFQRFLLLDLKILNKLNLYQLFAVLCFVLFKVTDTTKRPACLLVANQLLLRHLSPRTSK